VPIDARHLDTVFLDAGNTLVSMDFVLLCELLEPLGVSTSPQALARAEAAARPAVSRWVADGAPNNGEEWLLTYTRRVLGPIVSPSALGQVVPALVRAIRERVTTDRLWSYVLPGVPQALAELRAAGLTLVVVSNSDGTCEPGLVRTGLRPLVDAVVDSALVGAEKPDRRLFEHALALVGAQPERTLHVGDLYHVDVAGARAAGIDAVLLDPFDDWDDVDCERVPDLARLAERLVGSRPAKNRA